MVVGIFLLLSFDPLMTWFIFARGRFREKYWYKKEAFAPENNI